MSNFVKQDKLFIGSYLKLINMILISMINFVALDLETANAYRGSICQIGITELLMEKELSTRTQTINKT